MPDTSSDYVRTFEPRTSEPRTLEPRTSEPRTSEPRTLEPRTSEPRTFEPRTLNDGQTTTHRRRTRHFKGALNFVKGGRL